MRSFETHVEVIYIYLYINMHCQAGSVSVRLCHRPRPLLLAGLTASTILPPHRAIHSLATVETSPSAAEVAPAADATPSSGSAAATWSGFGFGFGFGFG